MRAPCYLLAMWLLVLGSQAHAHARSESYSNWDVSGDRITGVVTVSTGELMALMTSARPESTDALFARELTSEVSALSAGGACTPEEPVPLAAARGFERMEIAFDCAGEIPVELSYRALFSALPAHVHYARFFEDGRLLAEQVITDRADTWRRIDDAPRHSFTAFLDLGVRHILAGIDHIAFLVGMLLIAGTFGRSVAAVTGFTLGHSLSLGAAVLGYVSANGRLVEAFIGFTVALVAVEYFLLRRTPSRALPVITAIAAWLTGGLAMATGAIDLRASSAYLGFGAFAFFYLLAAVNVEQRSGRAAAAALFVVTACFGLVHGFGFAGFLMETGLGGDSLLLPLLGFNLGVEAGQLLLVGLAFLLARFFKDTAARRLAPFGAAALCGIGVFWFVGRSLAA